MLSRPGAPRIPVGCLGFVAVRPKSSGTFLLAGLNTFYSAFYFVVWCLQEMIKQRGSRFIPVLPLRLLAGRVGELREG